MKQFIMRHGHHYRHETFKKVTQKTALNPMPFDNIYDFDGFIKAIIYSVCILYHTTHV